jgi:uncharacterized protein (TIGR00730 family)
METTSSPDEAAQISAIASGVSQAQGARRWVHLESDYRSMGHEYIKVHQERLRARAGRNVVFIGSARTRDDSEEYRIARETSSVLTRRGWVVVSGGGPGIMTAAALGAASERYIAVGLEIAGEENNFASGAVGSTLATSFFARKSAMFHDCSAVVCLPGGIGTLDELTDILVLQHTGRIRPAPLILLACPGNNFWTRWLKFFRDDVVGRGFCSPSVLNRMYTATSPLDCVQTMEAFYANVYDISWGKDNSLVLSLRHPLTREALADLNTRYSTCVDKIVQELRVDHASTELRFKPSHTFHEILHEFVMDVNARTGDEDFNRA